MRHLRLDDMTRGWFVGDFTPAALRTEHAEVAVQHYREGDYEQRHVHRVATEITVILGGRARMCGQDWESGDIVVLDPGDPTDFTALTDVTAVVVKSPSVPADKYLLEDGEK
jgi:UDP-N-acetylmuramoylalanine-D-glutamate ligase